MQSILYMSVRLLAYLHVFEYSQITTGQVSGLSVTHCFCLCLHMPCNAKLFCSFLCIYNSSLCVCVFLSVRLSSTCTRSVTIHGI